MFNKFKLHHYGFATKSIKKSLIEFSKLGYFPIGEEIRDCAVLVLSRSLELLSHDCEVTNPSA